MIGLNQEIQVRYKPGSPVAEHLELKSANPVGSHRLGSELSLDEFRSIQAASPSRIKNLRRDLGNAPLHYQAALFEPWKETPATKFGSMYDMFILDPEAFKKVYVRESEFLNLDERPELSKGLTSKLNKAWKEEKLINADKLGLILTSDEDFQKCYDMRDVLHRFYPEALELLVGSQGKRHYKTLMQESDSGVVIKHESDMIIPRYGTIVDLKTTQSAAPHPKKFFAKAWDFGYFTQAAIELDTFDWATDFMWIVQETSFPYVPCVYTSRDINDDSMGEAIRAGREHQECGYIPLCKRLAALRNQYGSEWNYEAFSKGETWPGFGYYSGTGYDNSFVLKKPYWV